jgi:transcriptional regulator with XRE-family HTH domain
VATLGIVDEADSIGRRIARARKLREKPLTQVGLAAIVPCSKSLIAQVERGHKPATPALIAAVARALNIDVTELTGQPYGAGNAHPPDRIHLAIPPIRQALVYWDIPPSLDGPPRSLADLARVNRRAGHLRMQAGYTELGTLLPGLLKELTVHTHQDGQRDRERAFRLLADAYTAVDSMAYKLGYMDLFALAVERMAWAASHADDPLLRPVAVMRRSSAFMATGAWEGGLSLLDRAGHDLGDGDPGDPATLSVLGTVHLRAAVIAARGGMASSAWEHAGYAREVADRLGRDTKDYGLLFGPTNVAIHEVAIAVELGDADEAVRRGKDLSLPADLPRERSSHHYIDMSRAWLWQGGTSRALACVAEAERLAPQRTRYHPMARETVARLLDLHRQVPEQLRILATRMGMS